MSTLRNINTLFTVSIFERKDNLNFEAVRIELKSHEELWKKIRWTFSHCWTSPWSKNQIRNKLERFQIFRKELILIAKSKVDKYPELVTKRFVFTMQKPHVASTFLGFLVFDTIRYFNPYKSSGVECKVKMIEILLKRGANAYVVTIFSLRSNM
jgi:hypothetical protein